MATSRDLRQFMGGQAFGKTHIPKGADLSGKTVVVTGANTGIGFECAMHLSRLNATKLILGCRSLEKGNKAKEAIAAATVCKNTTIEVWKLDLADYQSVLAFGERVRATLSRLDAFISNAGVEVTEFSLAEGIEMTITVNVVSTMLLNIAVLPKLRETSVKYKTITTLTAVGSSVHIFGATDQIVSVPEGKSLDTFDILSDPATADMGQPDQEMSPRYALSKTLLHALMPHLAARASRPKKQEHVVVNCVNPGWCASDISRHKTSQPLRQRVLFALIGRTAEQGARTLVHAILAGDQTHGCYLTECTVKPESDFLQSETGTKMRERLWGELMARIERISPETAAFIE